MSETNPPDSDDVQGQKSTGRLRRFAIWALIIILVVAVLEFAGVDVIGWLGDVWDNIKSVPVQYLVIAVAFKTGETCLTALGWRNVLRPIYPEQRISYRLALGAYSGGVGINNIAPAKAGTWTMLGLYHLYIPNSRLATLLSAFAVQSIAFGVFNVINYIVIFLAHPDETGDETSIISDLWGYITDRPGLSILIAVSSALLLYVVFRAYRAKIDGLKDQFIEGGAVLRTPGNYLIHVFLPALLSYVCRWGYTAIFMAAFDIPVTFYTVFLVIAANVIAGAFGLTPGGLGTTQAIDVAVLSDYAPADAVTAYSLAQQAVLTAWNVVFGLGAMTWAFGWSETRDLIRDRKQITARMEAERDEEAAADAANSPPSAPEA